MIEEPTDIPAGRSKACERHRSYVNAVRIGPDTCGQWALCRRHRAPLWQAELSRPGNGRRENPTGFRREAQARRGGPLLESGPGATSRTGGNFCDPGAINDEYMQDLQI